jgi:hypothetical protein
MLIDSATLITLFLNPVVLCSNSHSADHCNLMNCCHNSFLRCVRSIIRAKFVSESWKSLY